jgi:hypothetical protein
MPRKRAHISTEAKLAAALLALGLVPYEDAKAMGETNFLSLFHFDHNILHCHDGGDEFWNLTPLNIIDHRKKTTKVDVPRAAKAKRLAAAKAALDTFLTTGQKPPLPGRPKKKIHGRGFPKDHRQMRSRSSFERRAT